MTTVKRIPFRWSFWNKKNKRSPPKSKKFTFFIFSSWLYGATWQVAQKLSSNFMIAEFIAKRAPRSKPFESFEIRIIWNLKFLKTAVRFIRNIWNWKQKRTSRISLQGEWRGQGVKAQEYKFNVSKNRISTSQISEWWRLLTKGRPGLRSGDLRKSELVHLAVFLGFRRFRRHTWSVDLVQVGGVRIGGQFVVQCIEFWR